MKNKIEIKKFGKIYTADNPYLYDIHHSSEDTSDVTKMITEVKVNVYDETGERYVAEYHIPHSRAVMTLNLTEYTDFMAKKYIPVDLLDDTYLYDII